MRRPSVTVSLCSLIAAAVAAGAAAAGGPSPGISLGSSGVTGRDAQIRYVAVPAGLETVVEKLRIGDAQVLRSRFLRGRYGVPLVAYDGSAGGLSHDAKTLVLSTLPGLPQLGGVTRFAVLDAKTLRVRRLIALHGTFAYDALAPDAATLYLIEFTSSQNYDRYRVRALDVASGRLVPGAIVDKREPKEPMTGAPVARVESADGAWVYTLYSRADKPPFVHALDAVHRTAVCVDLAWHGPQSALAQLRLTLSQDGRQLVLSRRDGTRVLAVAAPG
jgi:hypothetical protein